MDIYWLLLLIMLFVNILPIKNKQIRLFISFIPFFLYGALRINYGLDYDNNELAYDLIRQMGIDLQQHQEIGFQYLCRYCVSFRMLLIVTSTLVTLAFFFMIKEFVPEKYYRLSILMLFLAGDKLIFFQFSAIRNAIAIDLMLLDIILYNRGVKYYYLIFIAFLATLFHTSALIFIPFLATLLYKVELTNFKIAFSILLLVILRSAVGTPLALNIATSIMVEDLDRYAEYLDKIDLSHGASFFMIGFMIVYTFIIMRILKEHHGSLDRKSDIILRLALAYSFAMALGPLGFRANQYYAFLFILAPVVVWGNQMINKTVKNGLLVVVTTYLVYAFFVIFLHSSDFPYEEYMSILM